jgi:hypothetical protein
MLLTALKEKNFGFGEENILGEIKALFTELTPEGQLLPITQVASIVFSKERRFS